MRERGGKRMGFSDANHMYHSVWLITELVHNQQKQRLSNCLLKNSSKIQRIGCLSNEFNM